MHVMLLWIWSAARLNGGRNWDSPPFMKQLNCNNAQTMLYSIFLMSKSTDLTNLELRRVGRLSKELNMIKS